MGYMQDRMSWDDLRIALAVARHGSHSAAARSLGLTQPTVGRRLRAFEKVLGAPLFERSTHGVRTTRLGLSVVTQAERIEERVFAMERAMNAGSSGLAGQVRVTASDWLVARVLPRTLPTIAARAPDLRVDLASESQLVNLARNESDLALRPRRFESNGIYQRAVGYVAFAVYASREYLSRHGEPTLANRALGHALALMDDDAGPIEDVEWLRRVASRARVVARTNGREPLAALARLGAGFACLPSFVGDATPGLVRISALGEAPGRTLWLGVHRDRRELPRVAVVATAIREQVGAVLQR